ncbi:EscU/YscU/HrcU family type III secretion system export apparatus switch protein [Pseudomonas aeruginosa]|nr:EscU/YscU/HrcU family type III secretion system export apparatus switch protein [Pseudomonas aeruginosa]
MSAEKTEQPTAKKLRDARRQGQVVKSKEIVSSALILSLVALLMGFSDYYLEHLGKLLLLLAEYIDLPFRQALETILENLLQELLYCWRRSCWSRRWWWCSAMSASTASCSASTASSRT